MVGQATARTVDVTVPTSSSPAGAATNTAGPARGAIRKGSASPLILLSQPGLAPDGGPFSLLLTGPAGLTVTVESSSDLAAWTALANITLTNLGVADEGGALFTDSSPSSSSRRFYRASASLIPPSILTPPSSQMVNSGDPAFFSVVATGSPPPSYQWEYNDQALFGETNSTLALPGVEDFNGGNYSVLVANLAGSIQSQEAVLTVSPAGVPPQITLQPNSVTVQTGTNVTLVAGAAGTAPLAYQWSLNGTNIAGATGSFYRITNVQPQQAGDYTVTVSNAVGVATSQAATLTVNLWPLSMDGLVIAFTFTAEQGTDTNFVFPSFALVPWGPPPGSFLWEAAPNFYTRQPSGYVVIQAFEFANSSGVYNYSQSDPFSAELDLEDSVYGPGVINLTFTSPAGGTYVYSLLTLPPPNPPFPEPPSIQSGTFTIN